jgi:hypothetical protein
MAGSLEQRLEGRGKLILPSSERPELREMPASHFGKLQRALSIWTVAAATRNLRGQSEATLKHAGALRAGQ